MTRLDPRIPSDRWSSAPERANADEVESIARRRVDQARVDILLEHPYFAAALLVMPMRGTSEPSIRNAVMTDGHRIVYRYDLVAELERPKVRHLILHALAHALLRHAERGAGRDWRAWTAACDVAVEALFETLGLKVPGLATDLRAALAWAKGLSAEGIYARFEANGIVARNTAQRGAASRAAEGAPETRDEEASGDDDNDSEREDDLGSDDLDNDDLDNDDLASDGLIAPAPEDRSDARHEPRSRRARDAIARAVHDAPAPTAGALEALRHQFEQAVASAERAPRHGTTPGGGNAEIDAAGVGRVSWQTHLARFMQDRIGRDWSFARPNRKHLWRGLYLPGPVDIDGGHFVVAIDTSGSMSDAVLAQILAEVDAIRRSCACELTVLQFDAAIHATARFSQWQCEDDAIGTTRTMRCYGRGGTDLRLPFAWAEEARNNGERISALIVATDGYGPLPAQAPADLPVLFLLTPQHAPPRFGIQVALDRG